MQQNRDLLDWSGLYWDICIINPLSTAINIQYIDYSILLLKMCVEKHNTCSTKFFFNLHQVYSFVLLIESFCDSFSYPVPFV